MGKYGIHNVRGGSYQKEQLSVLQLNSLQDELEYISSCKNPSLKLEETMRYFIYSELLPLINTNDNTNDKTTKINNMQISFKQQLDKYQKIKENIKKIDMFYINDNNNANKNKIFIFDRKLNEQINYFQKYIINREFETAKHPNKTIIKIYKNLLNHFNHFIHVLKEFNVDLNAFLYEDLEPVFVSHPEFLFDRIVYLSYYHKLYDLTILNDEYLEKANKLCNIFEGMYYWCLNRLTEYEFDIKHLPKNLEFKIDMIDFVMDLYN
jgi:hypothetical protein